MKLRKLNGAIRKRVGAVAIPWVNVPNGPVGIDVQKGSLLAALKHVFGEGDVETHLILTEQGWLVHEDHPPFGIMGGAAATEPKQVDLEDAIAAADDDLGDMFG